MKPSLRFGSLVLLGVSWMVVAACGDGDSTGLGTSGSTGQSGGGGAHTGGGGGMHPGSAGSAGKGGSSATAGSSSGGTSANGMAGEGGEPTSGGTGGSAAGTGGALGGTGGASGGSAGSGGTGGAAGGTAGSAGTSGNGGTGGSAGSAGTGGASGGSAGSGGTGGTAGGAGGNAGSGGTGGNAAGTGGVSGGTGGTAGTGGAGGTGVSTLKDCAYQCATDDDCKITGEDPQSHFCNPTRKRCEDNSVCESQADCIGFASMWYGSCGADSDCLNPGDVCVASGGRGACATPPDPIYDCSLLIAPDSVPMQVARFGSAGNVEVCASPDGLCVDKACQFHCAAPIFGACPPDATTQCNASTGLCDCSSSTQCSAASGKPVCGASSQCECATSDQCAPTATVGLDHCYAGKCGCSSAAACPDSHFKNATPVCE